MGISVREGYAFTGWFTEPNGAGEKLTEMSNVKESKTVYAYWTRQGKLSAPAASIPTGSKVKKGTELVLSCADQGADIYYTVDDTDPAANGVLYDSPIYLNESVRIKAIAVSEGCESSDISEFFYTVVPEEDYRDDAGNQDDENKSPDRSQNKNDIKVQKLTISASSKKLAAGKKVRLTLAAVPENATDKTVTWQTGNSKYASVDKNGKVTLKKAGKGKTVTITAASTDGSNKKAKVKIKIK